MEGARSAVVSAPAEDERSAVVPASVECARSAAVLAPVEGARSAVVSAPVDSARSTVKSAPVKDARSADVPALVEVASSAVSPASVEGARSDVVPAPVEGARSAVAPAPVEGARSAVVPASVEGVRSAVVSAPVDSARSTVESATMEDARPAEVLALVEGARSALAPAPVEGARSDVVSAPAEGERSAVAPAPVEGARSADVPASVEGARSAVVSAPVEGALSAVVHASVEDARSASVLAPAEGARSAVVSAPVDSACSTVESAPVEGARSAVVPAPVKGALSAVVSVTLNEYFENNPAEKGDPENATQEDDAKDAKVVQQLTQQQLDQKLQPKTVTTGKSEDDLEANADVASSDEELKFVAEANNKVNAAKRVSPLPDKLFTYPTPKLPPTVSKVPRIMRYSPIQASVQDNNTPHISASRTEKKTDDIKHLRAKEFKMSRAVERVLKKVKKRRLKKVNVPKDGSCLFASVLLATGMQSNLSDVEKINKTEEARCVENLRNDVVTLGWKSYTSNANDAGDTNKVLIEHDDVDDYLENLRRPFTWGGSSELQLIANILNVVLIVVLEKGHIVYKPPDEFPKLVAAISYNGRNHYDPYVPHQLIKQDLYACEDISCTTITVPFHGGIHSCAKCSAQLHGLCGIPDPSQNNEMCRLCSECGFSPTTDSKDHSVAATALLGMSHAASEELESQLTRTSTTSSSAYSFSSSPAQFSVQSYDSPDKNDITLDPNDIDKWDNALLSDCLPKKLFASTSKRSIIKGNPYSSVPDHLQLKPINKDAEVLTHSTLSGFGLTKTLLGPSFVDNFICNLDKYAAGVPKTYRRRSVRLASDAQTLEQIGAHRENVSRLFFLPAPDAADSNIPGWRLKTSQDINYPVCELFKTHSYEEQLKRMEDTNSSGLTPCFSLLDVAARCILTLTNTVEAPTALHHGEKQKYFLDHMAVIEKADDGNVGLIARHKDRLFYGHVTVVFNLCGKATLLMKDDITSYEGGFHMRSNHVYVIAGHARYHATHEVKIPAGQRRISVVLRYIYVEEPSKVSSLIENTVSLANNAEMDIFDPYGVLKDRLLRRPHLVNEDGALADNQHTRKTGHLVNEESFVYNEKYLRLPTYNDAFRGVQSIKGKKSYMNFYGGEEVGGKNDIFVGRVNLKNQGLIGFGLPVILNQNRFLAVNKDYLEPVCGGMYQWCNSRLWILLVYAHKENPLMDYALTVAVERCVSWNHQENKRPWGSKRQLDAAGSMREQWISKLHEAFQATMRDEAKWDQGSFPVLTCSHNTHDHKLPEFFKKYKISYQRGQKRSSASVEKGGGNSHGKAQKVKVDHDFSLMESKLVNVVKEALNSKSNAARQKKEVEDLKLTNLEGKLSALQSLLQRSDQSDSNKNRDMSTNFAKLTKDITNVQKSIQNLVSSKEGSKVATSTYDVLAKQEARSREEKWKLEKELALQEHKSVVALLKQQLETSKESTTTATSIATLKAQLEAANKLQELTAENAKQRLKAQEKFAGEFVQVHKERGDESRADFLTSQQSLTRHATAIVSYPSPRYDRSRHPVRYRESSESTNSSWHAAYDKIQRVKEAEYEDRQYVRRNPRQNENDVLELTPFDHSHESLYEQYCNERSLSPSMERRYQPNEHNERRKREFKKQIERKRQIRSSDKGPRHDQSLHERGRSRGRSSDKTYGQPTSAPAQRGRSQSRSNSPEDSHTQSGRSSHRHGHRADGNGSRSRNAGVPAASGANRSFSRERKPRRREPSSAPTQHRKDRRQSRSRTRSQSRDSFPGGSNHAHSGHSSRHGVRADGDRRRSRNTGLSAASGVNRSFSRGRSPDTRHEEPSSARTQRKRSRSRSLSGSPEDQYSGQAQSGRTRHRHEERADSDHSHFRNAGLSAVYGANRSMSRERSLRHRELSSAPIEHRRGRRRSQSRSQSRSPSRHSGRSIGHGERATTSGATYPSNYHSKSRSPSYSPERSTHNQSWRGSPRGSSSPVYVYVGQHIDKEASHSRKRPRSSTSSHDERRLENSKHRLHSRRRN